MVVLLCKLALAPAFVVLVSLSVRRFGPRVGGIFGGLPVVAGPILFVYALDHGTAFAGDAAGNSLGALVALAAFVLTVAFVAGRETGDGESDHRGRARRAWMSVVAGWIVFAALAATVAVVDASPVVALAACAVAFIAALRVLPMPDPNAVVETPRRPPHDLLLRAGAAAAMVLVLTSLAGTLGPAASGVLAPFPTITSVLTGFAVANETRATTLRLMRGMIRGFFSFAACLFVLAVGLEPLGTAAAFALAIGATVAVQVGLLVWLGRQTAPVLDSSAPPSAEPATATATS